MTGTPEVVVKAESILGEGVNWDAERRLLYWVDIVQKELHIYNPATDKDRLIQLQQYIGAVVPRESGGLIVALQGGIASLDPQSGKLELMADPEPDRKDNRFNDGKCDPTGRFWVGTMHVDAIGRSGALYRMDTDLSIHKVIDGVGISNGLAWSHDGRSMYYIDTVTCELARFDYDLDSGTINNRRVVTTFPEEWGHADGMTIDAEGMLWIALCGGGRVTRWDPDRAELIGEIRLPAELVTNCAFGGENLDELYISTARIGLSEERLKDQPLAGSLFRVKPGVRGVVFPPFRG